MPMRTPVAPVTTERKLLFATYLTVCSQVTLMKFRSPPKRTQLIISHYGPSKLAAKEKARQSYK